ncbi:MAG: hypothetical protein AAF694_12660 [Bacteroidota bacterium]
MIEQIIAAKIQPISKLTKGVYVAIFEEIYSMRKKDIQLSGLILLVCFGILAIQASRLPVPSTFFEGTISYDVSFSGPESRFIEANEPNTKLDMHLKGANYIINLKGGQYPKTFLFIADSNREYLVEATKGRAYKFSKFSDRIYHEELDEEPKARGIGKKSAVNGIMCDVYLMKLPDTHFAYYVNDDYRVDLSAFPENCNSNASFLVNGLEGRIPLKTIKKQKGLTVTTTYDKIKTQSFDNKQFQIPSSFKVLNRDYRY